ncbi:HAD family hydrolase [Candidatus Magnetominusculus dajiuhuensis]|uniref:HAD family hydrolase n=1 Tax=Candidatus Magnetominusculus dajiuhuensis TaxID=3137712 RepID=UPI003B436522
MIKYIIFDFDGVLVESVDIKTRAFARVFEPEGETVMDRVVEYHLQNAGVSRFDKFRYIYETILERPLSAARFDALCGQFAELVVDEVSRAPFVKGALEFLNGYAMSIYTCFVSTATPQEEIEEIIRHRAMQNYFKAVHGAPKKKTAIVQEILDTHGIHPDTAIYVGDAMSDYRAAAANHVPFIARVKGDIEIFNGVNCTKITDLTELAQAIANVQGFTG